RLVGFREKQGRTEEAAALFAKALEKGEVFSEDAAMRFYASRGDYAAARARLEKWRAAYPAASFQYLQRLRDWERAAGKEVPATLEKLMAACPADPSPLNEAAEKALRAGDRDSAVAFWRRSRALAMRHHGTDPDVLRRLEDLAGPEDGLAAFDLKLADVNPAKVVKTSKASHAIVLRLEATRVYPDLSTVTFKHVAIKPFDRTGVDELGELRLPSRADMLYCRTVHPDGSVFVPDSADNDPRKAMSMYNVKPDSVLEYACRELGGSDNLFREGFNFQEFSADVARARYVLVLPRSLLPRLTLRLNPEDFAPTARELDGGDVALVWDAEKQEGVMPEKLLPQWEPPLRRVEARVFDAEDRRATWFDSVPPVRSSPAIDAKALEICRGCQTAREKLDAVYQWLATNVEDDDDSSSARDAFATRSGTLESRAMLCIAMLRAVGVRAYPGRANPEFSVQRGQLPRERMGDLRNGFNEAILAVELPGENAKEWLALRDDQKFYRLGDLGQKMTGVLALTNSPWGLRLENVRPREAELPLIAPPAYRLAADGSAKVSGAMVFTGALAGNVRRLLETPFRAKQALQKQLAGMHPHISELQLEYPQGEALTAGAGKRREDVRVGYQGVIRKYARPSGEGLMVRPTPQSEVEQLSRALPLPRVHDIELGRDLVSSLTVEYEAPEGWAFAEVPPDRSLPAEFGLYLQDYHVKGRRLTLARSLIIPAQRIKAAHAPAFARFLAKVAEFDEAGFRLVPLPEGVASTAIDDWGECGRYDVRDLRAFDLPENLRRLLPATGKPAPGQGDAPAEKAPAAAK
ncbi:MAG: hypothetical protein J6333_07065, partial [Planctomycetes bacterium]|nr:hypothetical protein [Planctomycetota bacterium]